MKRSALRRKSGLRRKFKSRFPKRRDPEFMAWFRGMAIRGVLHCQVCGGPAIPIHIKPKGSGGYDLGNVADLCWWHHSEQEGHTKEFEKKYGIDLQARANEIEAMYDGRYRVSREAGEVR